MARMLPRHARVRHQIRPICRRLSSRRQTNLHELRPVRPIQRDSILWLVGEASRLPCMAPAYASSWGLGWSFSAWKLHGGDDKEGDDGRRRRLGKGSKNIINMPSRLLCLRDVVETGLMPSSLVEAGNDGSTCLNGPKETLRATRPSPPRKVPPPIAVTDGGITRRWGVIIGSPPRPCPRPQHW
jgi:hypothetical protein